MIKKEWLGAKERRKRENKTGRRRMRKKEYYNINKENNKDERK